MDVIVMEEKKINTRKLILGIICLIVGIGLSIPLIILGVLMIIGLDITPGLGIIIGGIIVFGLALYYFIGTIKSSKQKQPKEETNLSSEGEFAKTIDLSDPAIIEQITWYSEESIKKRYEERLRSLTKYQRTEYEAKVAIAEESIKFEKNFKAAYIKLGEIHREFGFIEQALEAFMRGLKVFKDDIELTLEIGDLLLVSGDLVGASNVNQKVLEIDPYCWQAYLQLGVVFALQKEKKKAIEYTKKASEINQNAPDILNNLGLFYYHDEQIENALKTLKKVLSIKPTHQGALKNYRMILDDTNAIEKAGISEEDFEKEQY